MEFKVEATSGKARAGVCRMAGGTFRTPLFMPVGTLGAVKALLPDELREIGAEVVLGNAYHLYLRPGVEVVEAAGGLGRFMAWDGLTLTDSGGFQVFSLHGLRKVDDEGVEFRSHLDGSAHHLTPEKCVEIQRRLGADIVMALDECVPYGAPRGEVEEAVRRTSRWAERCQREPLGEGQALFGIVQGGVDPELRRVSAEQLAALDFPGYAIGGLSVGEPMEQAFEVTAHTERFLPAGRPRYLMGVGMPPDVIEAVEQGMDMFDCVLPTRMARNGAAFTARGRVALRNARHRTSEQPIDPLCDCRVCRTHTRAYIRHLFMSGEINAARLATFHNVYFYVKMMARMRQAIVDDNFVSFKKDFTERYMEGE